MSCSVFICSQLKNSKSQNIFTKTAKYLEELKSASVLWILNAYLPLRCASLRNRRQCLLFSNSYKMLRRTTSPRKLKYLSPKWSSARAT